MAVERFLDMLGHRAVVDRFFAEPGHGLVSLFQGQRLGVRDAQPLVPVRRVAVGARDHQSVQHGQVDGALDVEAELPFAQQTAQHIATPGLPPQPAEYEVGADADAPQHGQLATVETGEHD